MDKKTSDAVAYRHFVAARSKVVAANVRGSFAKIDYRLIDDRSLIIRCIYGDKIESFAVTGRAISQGATMDKTAAARMGRKELPADHYSYLRRIVDILGEGRNWDNIYDIDSFAELPKGRVIR